MVGCAARFEPLLSPSSPRCENGSLSFIYDSSILGHVLTLNATFSRNQERESLAFDFSNSLKSKFENSENMAKKLETTDTVTPLLGVLDGK